MEFEAIPQLENALPLCPITVTKPDSTYYVVKKAFIRDDMPYSVGQGISEKLYNSLSPEQKLKVDDLHFSENEKALGASKEIPVTFYYCRDSYTVNENGEGVQVKDVFDGEKITSGNPVPVGFIIDSDNFMDLPNKTVDDENDKQLFTITRSRAKGPDRESRRSFHNSLSPEKKLKVDDLQHFSENEKALEL